MSVPIAAQCVGTHTDFDEWQNGSYTVNGETPTWFILPQTNSRDYEIACIDGHSAIPAIWAGDCRIGCREISFTMKGRGDDDDSIGFVLGYRPGDESNPNADYLAVIWNRRGQTATLPGCGPAAYKPKGMHLTRVTGVPDPIEFWCLGNADLPCSDLSAGLEILEDATNLRDTGWPKDTPRDVVVRVTNGGLQIEVEGRLEFDVTMDMTPYLDGNFGFYTQSQFADFWGVEIAALNANIMAEFNNYGRGKAGCEGVPELTMMAPPTLGSAPQIRIGNPAQVAKTGALFWSGAPDNFYVPLVDLTLLVRVPLAGVTAMTIPAGGYTFECGIPDNSCAAGDEIFVQYLAIGCNGGIEASEGLRIQLGY